MRHWTWLEAYSAELLECLGDHHGRREPTTVTDAVGQQQVLALEQLVRRVEGVADRGHGRSDAASAPGVACRPCGVRRITDRGGSSTVGGTITVVQTDALVMEQVGRPLRVERVTVDPPGPGEVLVIMRGAGVCRSDLHAVDGDWRRPTPVVLGHEGAGVVSALGPGVSGLTVGDHVVLTWLPPCGACRSCRAGRTYLCTGSHAGTHLLPDGSARLHRADGSDLFQYSGLGTLSGAAVVTASSCVVVPSALPHDVAALIGCGAATGWGAVVNTAGVSAGQSVVVVGCGGVGLSALMAAAAAGADPLVAVDVRADKLDVARELGATHVVEAVGDWPDRVRVLTDGADVGLDCIGSPDVVTGLLDAVVPGGTVVMVGMTAQGVTVPVDGYRMPDAGWRLLGSAYGSCVAERDFPRIAALHLEGRLPLDRLVSHRIGLADVPEALAQMRAGRRLRSVVTW